MGWEVSLAQPDPACHGKCYLKTAFTSWWALSQKKQSSQRWGEGRIYSLQQVRRTPGIFPKAVSVNSKIGEVLS